MDIGNAGNNYDRDCHIYPSRTIRPFTYRQSNQPACWLLVFYAYPALQPMYGMPRCTLIAADYTN